MQRENECTNSQDGAGEDPPWELGRKRRVLQATRTGQFSAIDKECFWIQPRILIHKWYLVHPGDAVSSFPERGVGWKVSIDLGKETERS